jgi:predicted nucleic acid-binding protein
VSAFVDTSAFYALLVSTDDAHQAVRAAVEGLLDERRPLWTTSFVIVETMALLQHRVGMAAARDFDDDVLPTLRVEWIDERLYRRGADRLRREDRRGLSLVDCVSFECMIERGLTTALAVDPHFGEAGFTVVPSASSPR